MAELSSLTQMPLTSEFLSGKTAPKTPKGYVGMKEIAPVREELAKAQAGAEQEIGMADIEIEKAKRAENVAALESKAKRATETASELRNLSEREALVSARQELRDMAFVPKKDTAMDIAALFSLTSVIGMAIGGSGKMHAQQAMSAMNGMLEGYQKGRADLYKKQQIEFDKNFKAMQFKVQTLEKEYEEAVKLYMHDKEAGDLAAQAALAKAESPLFKAMENKVGKAATLSAIKELRTSVDKGVAMQNDLQTKADAERRHKENLAAQERRHKESLQHAEEMAKIRAAQKGDVKAGAVAGQVERMTNAMTQVSGAINSVASLPITTTAPVFGQKEFKGLFSAPLSVLNQNMSKETSQMLQGRMVGVARNLASLETGGAATGLAALTDSIQSGVAIPAGAKMHVALDKLAEMRRIVEDAARAALSSSKYTEDQKQLIRENVAIVQKAVPFTLDDVAEAVIASKGKSPKVAKEDRDLTFTQYINKYGVGSSNVGKSEGQSNLSDEEQAELEALRAKHGRPAQ